MNLTTSKTIANNDKSESHSSFKIVNEHLQ